MTIAAAGANPAASEAHALIRRNHPDRFFSVVFSDGSSRIGYPIPVPKVNSPTFNPDELSRSFGLSPRQATLTARLAEGEALAKIANELGMTLSTARWHLREVFRRTNSHSQAELVSLAKRVCRAESFDEGNWTRKSTSKNAPKRYGVDLSTGGHSFLMLTQPYLATETAVYSPRSNLDVIDF